MPSPPSKFRAFLVLVYFNSDVAPSARRPILFVPFIFIWVKASASVKLIFACPTLIPVELSESSSNETLYFLISLWASPEAWTVKSKFNPIDCSTLLALFGLLWVFPWVASWVVPFKPPILIFHFEPKKLVDLVSSGSVFMLAPTDWSPNISMGVFNCISAQLICSTVASPSVAIPKLWCPYNFIIPLFIELLFTACVLELVYAQPTLLGA